MDFYVFKNNQQVGPFSLMALRDKLQTGEFAYTDLAWRDGLKDWTPLRDILGGSLPDATPHAVAAPGTAYAAPARAQTPTGARVATAAGIFFILFFIIFVVAYFAACILLGMYAGFESGVHNPGNTEAARDSAMVLVKQYLGLILGCSALLSLLVSALIAYFMSFSNLFPWCRAK